MPTDPSPRRLCPHRPERRSCVPWHPEDESENAGYRDSGEHEQDELERLRPLRSAILSERDKDRHNHTSQHRQQTGDRDPEPLVSRAVSPHDSPLNANVRKAIRRTCIRPSVRGKPWPQRIGGQSRLSRVPGQDAPERGCRRSSGGDAPIRRSGADVGVPDGRACPTRSPGSGERQHRARCEAAALA